MEEALGGRTLKAARSSINKVNGEPCDAVADYLSSKMAGGFSANCPMHTRVRAAVLNAIADSEGYEDPKQETSAPKGGGEGEGSSGEDKGANGAESNGNGAAEPKGDVAAATPAA